MKDLSSIYKLNWTEIFQDTNNPEVPDMAPIPFTGEREEFDVDITEEEINSMKDSNGTIQFIMDVMRWCLPRFDNGETDLFTWQAQQIMSNYRKRRGLFMAVLSKNIIMRKEDG